MISDDLKNLIDVGTAQRNGECFSDTAQDQLFIGLREICERISILERMAVVNTSALAANTSPNVIDLAGARSERKAT